MLYDLWCIAHLFVSTFNHQKLFLIPPFSSLCLFYQPAVLMFYFIVFPLSLFIFPFFLLSISYLLPSIYWFIFFFFFSIYTLWPPFCHYMHNRKYFYRKLIEIYDYISLYRNVANINQGQIHDIIKGLTDMYHFLPLVYVGSGIWSGIVQVILWYLLFFPVLCLKFIF